ncbi:MAG: DUF3990 domain-containing protein [Prevotella sp.]|nr:DUF3990 domain-containing protein [Prevotella sp.]MBR6319012.1 DUF3990 domain-containing protein [Prevotella sp.]
MELYHGSYTIVEEPRVLKGRYTKDFGTGFYCTLLKQQAERWAGRFDTPMVNVYNYTLKESLRVLEFKEMTDEWLDFVVDCRAGKAHDYDIVIGAMADDQIFNYIADFSRGVITREQFWALAKFKYPTHQMAFCTKAALDCLTFKTVYSL